MSYQQIQVMYSVLLLCLIHIHWINPATVSYLSDDIRNSPQAYSFPNCSQYQNDGEIMKRFSYDLQYNPVFDYPSTTYALRNATGTITSLNIAKQKCIPSLIYCLKYLEKLVVQKTHFCHFKQRSSSAIKYLPSSLVHLHISNSEIHYLPLHIGTLKRLQTLDLSNIGLMRLPHTIGNLSSLTSLYLPNNKLQSLPPTIANLRSLESITLTNNPQLHSIQPINGLSSLRILHTDNCPIELLPLNLSNLTYLYMSNNSLTNLDGIETLGNGTSEKKSFHFAGNHLRSIPPQIRSVNNLSWLVLNNNQLNNLPTDIFNVSTLTDIFLRNNRFRPHEKKTIVAEFKKKNPNITVHFERK